MRLLLVVAVLTAGHSLEQKAEEPRPQSGHFPAVVDAAHEGTVALTVGERAPGLPGLLAELVTGRPRVQPDFIRHSEGLQAVDARQAPQLAASIQDARAAAATLLGREGPVVITHADDPALVGAQVLRIGGEAARLEVWWQQLDLLLQEVMADGVSASRNWDIPIMLADGRELRVGSGAVMVARHAVTAATVAKASGVGATLTDTAFYAVTPTVVLQTAPPSDRETLMPPNVDGSSAGLAYALSYLDAETDGQLFAGRKVAATGVITAAGEVLPIGGFLAKREAAVAAGAEILFVAAGSGYDGRPDPRIRIVEVRQLADAADLLCGTDGRRGGTVMAEICRSADEAVTLSARSTRDAAEPKRMEGGREEVRTGTVRGR